MKSSGQKKVSLTALILLLLAAILLTFMTTYTVMNVKWRAKLADQRITESEKGFDEIVRYDFDAIRSAFSEYYYYYDEETFDRKSYSQDVIESYLRATGDPYAYYWTAEEYADYNKTQAGDFVGIGTTVTYSEADSAIELLVVYPDSPAEKAGLAAGDLIVSVDGKPLSDFGKTGEAAYENAVQAIRGTAGTDVMLGFVRDGSEASVTLTRAACRSMSAFPKMLSDGKTGYLRITEYNGTTAEDFRNGVGILEDAGCERLVIDLRSNPGGQLTSVLDVLSYILPKDTLLSVFKDVKGSEQKYYSTDEHTLDLPIAILTDGNTASAAELFTACMKDYGKAVQVGVKTFGKGCAQNLMTLPSGGALKLTTHVYTSALTENYDGVGLYPDIEIALSEESAKINLFKLTEDQDQQLKAVLDYFNK